MQATSALAPVTGATVDPSLATTRTGALAALAASHEDLRRELDALVLPTGSLGVVLALVRDQLVAAGLGLQLHLRLAKELVRALASLPPPARVPDTEIDQLEFGLEALQESLESLLGLPAGDARLPERIAALRYLADRQFADEQAMLFPRLSTMGPDLDALGHRLESRRREMLADLGLDVGA